MASPVEYGPAVRGVSEPLCGPASSDLAVGPYRSPQRREPPRREALTLSVLLPRWGVDPAHRRCL